MTDYVDRKFRRVYIRVRRALQNGKIEDKHKNLNCITIQQQELENAILEKILLKITKSKIPGN